MNKDSDFFYFWFFWMILGVSSLIFFHFYKNAKVKRVIHLVLTIFASIAFGMFFFYKMNFRLDWFIFLFFCGGAFITFLNIRNTKFCNNCGKTIYRRALFSKIESCPKCGEKNLY